jgi:1-acyl-sn-glycerol-3-phosphate acyltransferase
MASAARHPSSAQSFALAPEWELVRRFGPSLAERVNGSATLAARQRFGRRLCHALGRVNLTSLGNVPTSGSVILAVNHRSLMDGPLLFGFVGRAVSCLVKAEAFTPLGGRAGRLLVEAAQIPVNRGLIDPAPIRLVLDILNAGGVVGIFPEGTRGDGRVRRARPGVGYFALRTGATVVPIAIHGSADLTHRRHIRRPSVTMTVGESMRLSRGPADRPTILNRGQWLAATEAVRTRLGELVAATDPLAASQPSGPEHHPAAGGGIHWPSPR